MPRNRKQILKYLNKTGGIRSEICGRHLFFWGGGEGRKEGYERGKRRLCDMEEDEIKKELHHLRTTPSIKLQLIKMNCLADVNDFSQ